jgi:tripeptidyl-peptidase-1
LFCGKYKVGEIPSVLGLSRRFIQAFFTMRISLIAVCSLAAGVLSAPTTKDKHVVHERKPHLPAAWRRSVKIHGDSVIPMKIALTQNNLHRAEEFLMEVSHPESPNFGQHWSAQKIAETFAPNQETVDAVREWLADAGIEDSKQTQSKNWIVADVTVAQAEDLLKTTYYEYEHSTGKSHVACEDYSIPESLSKHIDFITPTVHFDAKLDTPKKKRAIRGEEAYRVRRQISAASTEVKAGSAKALGHPGAGSLPKNGGVVPENEFHASKDLSNCDVSITPDCLRALYDLPSNVPIAKGNNSEFE